MKIYPFKNIVRHFREFYDLVAVPCAPNTKMFPPEVNHVYATDWPMCFIPKDTSIEADTIFVVKMLFKLLKVILKYCMEFQFTNKLTFVYI